MLYDRRNASIRGAAMTKSGLVSCPALQFRERLGRSFCKPAFNLLEREVEIGADKNRILIDVETLIAALC